MDIYIIYNNFDYWEGIKHQFISNYIEMCFITIEKIFRDANIFSGDLKQSILYYEVLFTIERLFYSFDAIIYDETAIKIDIYFIVKAIRSIYLKSVKSIFSTSVFFYSVIPIIELFKLWKTNSKMFGPILFNKDILDDFYEVIKNIYKYQFQLDNKEFDDRLFLTFDDQKTSLFIRSI